MNPKTRANNLDLTVDISVPYNAWALEKGLNLIGVANSAVRETLLCATLPEPLEGRKLEVSIVLANDDLLHTLNREYRHQDKPTNVLSFSQIENVSNEEFPDDPAHPVCIGDILLAYETVKKEADEKLLSLHDHLVHLLVHGTLHLIGYDHETDEETEEMQDLEIWITGRLGLKNPYT